MYTFNLYRICTSKLKLTPKLVIVRGDSIITVNPNKTKYSLNTGLSLLKEMIPNIVVKVNQKNTHIMNKYSNYI